MVALCASINDILDHSSAGVLNAKVCPKLLIVLMLLMLLIRHLFIYMGWKTPGCIVISRA